MFDAITSNKRRSVALVAAFVALVVVAGWAFSLVVGFGPLGVLLALVIAIGGSALSWWKSDAIALAMSHARPADTTTYARLHNIVEGLCIAAGVPKPRLYVIEDDAPNAFATGRDPKHASVAITTGLLEKLDREELQGVIGHELSHVRNFDIRFALIVGVMVGAIAILADFFLRFTFWGGGRRGRDRDGGGGQAIIFFIAIALAILAPIIARFIQLAVSRQREYLADASAVELTRNPYGLERALAKISGDPEVLEVANRGTMHMYFTNPIKKFEERSSNLFSTHPQVVDRINRLRELTGEAPLTAPEAATLAGLE